MTALRNWWAGRTRREQGLLLVMAALAAIVLSWLLIVRPLAGAREEARLRYDEAVAAVADARAAKARQVAPAVASPPLPVDSLVSRTANEAGFADAQVRSEGPARASVSISAARPQAAFGWIASLERQGLSVLTLDARANSDQTLRIEARFGAEAG